MHANCPLRSYKRVCTNNNNNQHVAIRVFQGIYRTVVKRRQKLNLELSFETQLPHQKF